MAVKRLMWTYCRIQPLIVIYEEKRRESSIICTAVVEMMQREQVIVKHCTQFFRGYDSFHFVSKNGNLHFPLGMSSLIV